MSGNATLNVSRTLETNLVTALLRAAAQFPAADPISECPVFGSAMAIVAPGS